jgi:hypothetical protein
MFDSMIVFANPSSLNIPVTREPSKTGIWLIELLLILLIASCKDSFFWTAITLRLQISPAFSED